ncbi:hypothetical protein [Actinoplanes sp. GCM10030250]|uniref:hypothetical protein n=1 Tax=Actinoplanes sp. GCM10030250 TaxID=3273376 RepID=UPI0036079BFC
MTQTSTVPSLTEALRAARALGERAARSLVTLAGQADDDLRGLAGAGAAAARCEQPRPPACWLPTELPPISCEVGRGGTARICFRVHNGGLTTRTVFVAATGPDAGFATGHPSSVNLGALETGELVAVVTLPDGVHRADLILWVRGCGDTAVRLTVVAEDDGCSCERRIDIEDAPGTRHEWHDHFDQPCGCRR